MSAMRTKLPFAGVQGGHQGKGHFDLSSGPGLRLHLPGGPKHATLGLVATVERSSGFGADMNPNLADIGYAIEVFVRGHSAKKSQTFPYEASRVGPLWVMRDAPRRNHSDYRKEEWIAHGIAATEADAIARRQSRGRFFVCPIIGKDEPEEPVRSAYKSLGYRLLATEAFFVQPLTQIPAPDASVQIERVRSPERAAQLGKATRTRPIADHLLLEDAPFRQYVALDDGEIVGQVRSIDAAGQPGARICMSVRHTVGGASVEPCFVACCRMTSHTTPKGRICSQVMRVRFYTRTSNMI